MCVGKLQKNMELRGNDIDLNANTSLVSVNSIIYKNKEPS